MPWFVPFLISIAVTLISRWLAGRIKDEQARDETARELRFSKVRYALPVAVVLGHGRVGGVYIDLGNFQTHEETDEYGKAGQRVFFTYSVEIQQAICMGPVDKLVWLELGNTVHAANISRAGDYFSWPANWVKGVSAGKFYWGTDSQSYDARQDALLGHAGLTPAYKSVCYAALKADLGTSTTPPSFSWIVERFPQPIGAKPAMIGDHANPVQLLYFLLTDTDFFLGLALPKVNLTSFNTASDTLVAEGLGVSIVLEAGTENIGRYIGKILDWIDGILIRENDIVYLRLRRPGSPTDTVTAADIKAGVKLKRAGWSSVKSMASVEFYDSNRECDQNVIHLEDPAARAASGHLTMQKYNFGVTATVNMAKKVLARKLFSISFPFAMLEFETTKTNLSREQLVTITYGKLNITGTWRIINISRKARSDVSSIVALEEQLRPLTTFEYESSVGDNYVEPPLDTDAITWFVWEDYWKGILVNIVKVADDTRLLAGGLLAAYFGTTKISGDLMFVSYNCLGEVRTQLNWSGDVRDFDQTLEVTSINAFDSSILATVGDDGWYSGAIALLLKTGSSYEVIFVQNVTEQAWGWQFDNLIRGMKVTVPVQHNVGSYVFLISMSNIDFWFNSRDQYVGEAIGYNLIPAYALAGGLSTDEANEDTTIQTYEGKELKPLPVVNIEIDGQGNDNQYPAGGDVVFAWSPTCKIGGAGLNTSVRASAENSPQHTGYVIEVYDSVMQYKVTYVTTDTTWAYSHAQRVADGATADYYVRIFQQGQFLSEYLQFYVENI